MSEEIEWIDVPMPLLVTSGDPGGIGPEVTHGAVRMLRKRRRILPERPVAVIGDAYLYARMLKRPREMHTYHILPVDDFVDNPGYMLQHIEPEPGKPWRPLFLDCGFKDEASVPVGKVSKEAGERAATYLDAALDLLGEGLSDAVCTAPICKEAMSPEVFPYPGHTELFADELGVKHPVMMLSGGGLRVALATIHEPLSRVPELLTRPLLRAVLRVVREAMREDFGIADPRIAVCGLNPHAGENGMFGDEEQRIIEPAITMAREAGYFVEGPFPADTLFWRAMQGQYDGIVAMYHDQGLIPVKLVAFESACQTTLGLPIVRTSVDHGTAFDIAGQNKANPESMKSAIRLACQLALRRRELPPPVEQPTVNRIRTVAYELDPDFHEAETDES